MNILYLSCHSVLEYEELKLFSSLGHKVLSTGSYSTPKNPGDKGAGRPALDIEEFPELLPLLPKAWDEKIDWKLVAWADVIITPGIASWLAPNRDCINKFIFRSIGQSYTRVEDEIMKFRPKGMKVVRYSPAERRLLGYAGEDAMIRFYKDATMFSGWTGKHEVIVTVSQSMKKRGDTCGFNVFEQATRGLPRHLYGRGNDPEDWITGEIPFELLQDVYRQSRVFFYTGTAPAQYTLGFMEAWMTGTPIVAAGRDLLAWDNEIPELIEDGANGFISNDMSELRQDCYDLLANPELAAEIGKNGREAAKEIFNEERIKVEWKEFLEVFK